MFQSSILLFDCFSTDGGLKRGKKKSLSSSLYGVTKGGCPLLSGSMGDTAMINIFHKATLKEKLKRVLLT